MRRLVLEMETLDMPWIYDIAYFFGGLFLTNAVPHFVNGVTGHPFQTPFAKPPGKGLSSSRTNVLWGVFNLAVGYGLVFRIGDFAIRANDQALAFGAGILVAGLILARIFSPLHGGSA